MEKSYKVSDTVYVTGHHLNFFQKYTLGRV